MCIKSILSTKYQAQNTQWDINKQKQRITKSKPTCSFATIGHKQTKDKQHRPQKQTTVYINQEIQFPCFHYDPPLLYMFGYHDFKTQFARMLQSAKQTIAVVFIVSL